MLLDETGSAAEILARHRRSGTHQHVNLAIRPHSEQAETEPSAKVPKPRVACTPLLARRKASGEPNFVTCDGAIHSQVEVGRRTYSDPNTMGAMLALMETRGLVKRMRNPNDGRARTVAAEPKGKRIFAKVVAHREAIRHRMEALFTAAEVETLVGFLRRIIQELSVP